MRAAIALRDVVGEAQHRLVIGVGPFHRHFDGDAVLLAGHHDRRLVQRVLGAVEIAHESLDAALVVELVLLRLDAAQIGQDQPHAGIEESQLAQAVLQRRVVEHRLGEDRRRRQEGDLCAALAVGVVDHLQRRLGIAHAEAHEVLLAVAPDLEVEMLGERVDHRHADAVQTAGDLVGVLVEFSAGMQLGHDDLGRGDAFLLVDVDRDAAAVVAHGDRAVAVQHHVDPVAEPGERFVDGVVDHLIDHVVQARAVIGVADVHAGALAHGVQALEHLDRVGVVGFVVGIAGGVLLGFVAHGPGLAV
ncbi:MAG: hypothetical protein BWY59_00164 [Verrucomicrobia bacterium ADurb.Bin345]|nr:MAG: hypothetical protein BWY59_00164 [Verrucomicrobia bacterium ADurb.Bin345]